MANHKSAEKRARQSERRRERNRTIKSRMRTVVKDCLVAIDGAAADAGEKLRAAERALRQAASKGVIPKRRAGRRVSRLAKRAAKAAKS